MLKKSCLLEYLIKYADSLKKNDGKKALTANYFVISLLQTVNAVENNRTPSEINNEDAQKELTLVCEMLKKYGFDKGQAVLSIIGFISSPDYKSSMDEFMFSKIIYNAESRAKKKGLDVIDTRVYLELIFAEPTEAINKFVLSKEKKSDAAEDKEDEDVAAAKLFEEIIRMTREAGVDPSVSEPLEAEKFEEISGAQKLSQIVQKTRNIQSVLLENVFGQDQAINTFVSGYFQAQLMSYSRKGTRKPQATFLFAGPPGVGKTFLAEKSAEALKLPYKRFDMSEYSNDEANLEFCGSDKVYKHGKAGNVTSFVAENPHCVLLFDEIEKAHIKIIYLFLQILDAGRIRDNFTDEEISFSDTVIIFTTNVGKNLYEDPTVTNLSAIPRKKILKALATDVDPATKVPLFPAAICSRFASGNVVMFNHLEASNLYTIADRELKSNAKGFENETGIKLTIDNRVPSAIMFSEGGKADARTVKGRANAFFHDELYELFRLLASSKGADAIEKLTQIKISVPLEGLEPDIADMFESPVAPSVLLFADGDLKTDCMIKLAKGNVVCHVTNNVEMAKHILFKHDVGVVLCDVNCGISNPREKVLNADDIVSVGQDFLSFVLEKYSLPVYIIQPQDGVFGQEEILSFVKRGVRGVMSLKSNVDFAKQVIAKCKIAYQQGNMLKLARENKALSYKTSQTISRNQTTANINLFNFRLSLVTDTEDSKNILDNVSRPDLHFKDVIGAEDAKQELKYFVEFLKNPVEYLRKGVRSPKGVLLYGPPGTGKTLLAKAMAGESGVTFLRAEGNEFLKRYVGEGAEAVHSLFNAARKYAPSIVFIDEIDAIGKDRNSLGDGDSNGDVLTALLTEMDGFNTDTTKPVFVLAATNYGVEPGRGKSLDAALLRRFDRRIYIDLPNKEERKRYIEMKLNKSSSVKLSADQVENIALRSTGMSLAELESVFEMALRSAIRSENGTVGDAEFEEAFETFNSGEKKEWSPDTLKRTARHEAGHALICWMSGEKPTYLTIVSRGDHGGYMQHANSEDKAVYTKNELLGKIRTSLGGRASEVVYYGAEDGISTGASGDLYSATRIAEQMICSYGMDESVGMSCIDPSTAASQEIRAKINSILSDELKNAISIIESNKKAIDAMVDALLERNHLKEKEIDEIFSSTVKK